MSKNDKNEPEVIDTNLPAVRPNSDLATISKDVGKLDPLRAYIREISRYKLLTPEEEEELTMTLYETGDIEAAKKLVTANLRLVVKIAMEYRKSYQNILDLIQEGNIGLMKAVSKYDPHQGAKLSYYASWWIKSYILKFILDNFRLIKIGTTKDQKKLFYNLMKEKSRLEAMGISPDAETISKNLGVSEKAVIEMEERIGEYSGEISLDMQAGDSNATIESILPADNEALDEFLSHHQDVDILKEHLHDFLEELKDRDRDIFQKRLLDEVPLSLQAIADEYGVSRERIRQIEARLLEKLKVYMSEFMR